MTGWKAGDRPQGASNLSKPVSATPSVLSWPCPPETIYLESNQVHIWCAALSDFDGELPRFRAVLSPTEQLRAKRFRFPKDRDHYVIRHTILRVLLGCYLEQRPSEIDFRCGRFGKPEINGDAVGGRLHFNDSHSGNLALFAVTRSCSIGVDVEHLRPVPHFAEIASRFFSPGEAEMLMATSAASRMESFFACWTRKEAFLKATGEGISESLAKVEVTLSLSEEPKILRIGGKSPTQTKWQLRSFSPAPGYLAALAFRHSDLSLCKWRIRTLSG